MLIFSEQYKQFDISTCKLGCRDYLMAFTSDSRKACPWVLKKKWRENLVTPNGIDKSTGHNALEKKNKQQSKKKCQNNQLFNLVYKLNNNNNIGAIIKASRLVKPPLAPPAHTGLGVFWIHRPHLVSKQVHSSKSGTALWALLYGFSLFNSCI